MGLEADLRTRLEAARIDPDLVLDQVLVSWDGSADGTRILDPRTGKEVTLEMTSLELRNDKSTGFRWTVTPEIFIGAFVLLADLNQPIRVTAYDRPEGFQHATALLLSPDTEIWGPVSEALLPKDHEEKVTEFCEHFGLGVEFARALDTSLRRELVRLRANGLSPAAPPAQGVP